MQPPRTRKDLEYSDTVIKIRGVDCHLSSGSDRSFPEESKAIQQLITQMDLPSHSRQQQWGWRSITQCKHTDFPHPTFICRLIPHLWLPFFLPPFSFLILKARFLQNFYHKVNAFLYKWSKMKFYTYMHTSWLAQDHFFEAANFSYYQIGSRCFF